MNFYDGELTFPLQRWRDTHYMPETGLIMIIENVKGGMGTWAECFGSLKSNDQVIIVYSDKHIFQRNVIYKMVPSFKMFYQVFSNEI